MFPLIAIAAVIGFWLWSRSSELFMLSVRQGRVLVVRGRISPGLLSDVERVVRDRDVSRATIRALKTESGGQLRFSGSLDDKAQQTLRNIFGLYPMAQLRHAPSVAKPSLGQLIGVAWIAWIFEGLIDRRG
jgi:hypothetical protein